MPDDDKDMMYRNASLRMRMYLVPMLALLIVAELRRQYGILHDPSYVRVHLPGCLGESQGGASHLRKAQCPEQTVQLLHIPQTAFRHTVLQVLGGDPCKCHAGVAVQSAAGDTPCCYLQTKKGGSGGFGTQGKHASARNLGMIFRWSRVGA